MRRRGTARRRSGVTLLLAALVAGLAYANWRVAELEIDISPAAAGSGPVAAFASPALEPPAEPQPLAAFGETIRRPLFTAGRRPPQPPEAEEAEVLEAAAGEAGEAPPPDFQLLGIAIDGATRQALLRRPGEREGWVREGEEVAGWRLDRVGADGIVLGAGERSHALSLYPARDAAGGQ